MIAIIDYNSGNVASVSNALKKLGKEHVLTKDADEIRQAERVIFPGQGRARFAMDQLEKYSLIPVIQNLKVPFLGICLGLQLLSNFSEEDDISCLEILNGDVKKFPETVKIPQIGWNKVRSKGKSALFKDIPDYSYFYFVNSYYYLGQSVMATSNYGIEFAAAVSRDNFFATQFHPEKSGEVGLKLLNNFCEL
ncbi:MAG: imidazole glycerol phosphate synthase subunit HisH [bacterium]|nr:imidazole glycerol phosphate synthase subunit HisH [bacterium]